MGVLTWPAERARARRENFGHTHFRYALLLSVTPTGLDVHSVIMHDRSKKTLKCKK